MAKKNMKKTVFHLTTRGGISVDRQTGEAKENAGGGVYTAMLDAKDPKDKNTEVVWVGKENAIKMSEIDKWSEKKQEWKNLTKAEKNNLSKGLEFIPLKGSLDNGLSLEIFPEPEGLKALARKNTLDFLWGPGGHGFTNIFEENKKQAVKNLKETVSKKETLKQINKKFEKGEISKSDASRDIAGFLMKNSSKDKVYDDIKALTDEENTRILGDPTVINPELKKTLLKNLDEGKYDDLSSKDVKLEYLDKSKIEEKTSKISEADAFDISFKHQNFEAAHAAKMMKKRMEKEENPVFNSQDYDNELVPNAIKDIGFEGPVATFRHIPVLSVEEMNSMKVDGKPLLAHQGVKEYMLRHASSVDVMGFQTQRDVDNVCSCLKEIAGDGFKKDKNAKDGVYDFFGKKVMIKRYPIGINPERITSLATKKCEGEEYKAVKDFAKGKKLCYIGGCRADYTKGLDESVEAADMFLKKVKKYDAIDKNSEAYNGLSDKEKKEFDKFSSKAAKNTVFYIQVQPTRGGHKDFDEYSDKLKAKFSKMKKEFPNSVKTRFDGLPHAELMGVMRLADIKIDVSLKDGMALVPKEFIAAQHGKENPGMAIVADGMGVAERAKELSKEIEDKMGIKNAYPVVDNPVSYKSKNSKEPNKKCCDTIVSSIVDIIERPAEDNKKINNHIYADMQKYDLKWWNKEQSQDLEHMFYINSQERFKEDKAFKNGKAEEYYSKKLPKSMDITPLVSYKDADGKKVKRKVPPTPGQFKQWCRTQMGYSMTSKGYNTVAKPVDEVVIDAKRKANMR